MQANNRFLYFCKGIAVNELTKQSTSYDPLQSGHAPNLMSDLVQSLFKFALKMHQLGHLEEAYAAYHEILNIDHIHYESIHLIGVIYIQIQQPKKALPYLNQAIEFKKDFAAAYSNRGRAFEDLDDLLSALNDYNKAVILEPQNVSFIKNQINILRKQKNYLEALVSIDKILLLVPDDVEVLNNKGVILFEQKKYDEAIFCYKKALSIKQNFPECLSNLGNSLAAQKKFGPASEKYSEAIALNPDYHIAYINRGHIFKILNYLPRALFDYQKATLLAPSDPNTHWNEALCLLTLKNFEDGWCKYEARLDIKDLDILTLGADLPPSLLVSRHLPRSEYIGKRVFLASEQGIGDEIMFLSILPDLLEDALHVTAQCDARSLALLARSFPEVKFIDKLKVDEIPLEEIDVAIISYLS